MARVCDLVFLLYLVYSPISGQLYDLLEPRRSSKPYNGEFIGKLKKYAHKVKGDVYAVDDDTFFIKGFTYDGVGPDAFFWVGSTDAPSPDGKIARDNFTDANFYSGDNDTTKEPPVLPTFNNQDVLVNLPNGMKLSDIKWISVWCRRFTVNFGDVYLPLDLKPPRPRNLPEFRRLAHGLRSGNITILDRRTFYIPNLHYDGEGPAAYFWAGKGPEPGLSGTIVPNEKGSKDRLERYSGVDIEIQLPGNMTVDDIDWLSVWCKLARQNFGHVFIPKKLHVPPALGQTKITKSRRA